MKTTLSQKLAISLLSFATVLVVMWGLRVSYMYYFMSKFVMPDMEKSLVYLTPERLAELPRDELSRFVISILEASVESSNISQDTISYVAPVFVSLIVLLVISLIINWVFYKKLHLTRNSC